MTYPPWFYLIAFASCVGLGMVIGLRAHRPATVVRWSFGIGAFATFGAVLGDLHQSSTFSLVEAIFDLIEVAVMIAGPAFAIRAIVTRLRPAGHD
jgi:hypothetical protein